MQADRRRLNAPTGGTSAPVYDSEDTRPTKRLRLANEHRRIFLRTGIVPTAAGSAYYELQPDQLRDKTAPLDQRIPSFKLSVSIHGPRPLPRNAAFSSNLLLNAHVKFAPFATQVRRGYVRDWSEKDLGVRLETALRGVIIAERWPKSAVDVVVTILESDSGSASNSTSDQVGMMTVLAGAVTASGAALVDAGIDCIGMIAGGVAAVTKGNADILIDPVASDQSLAGYCYVAYIPSRNELTDCWKVLKDVSFDQSIAVMEQACKSAEQELAVSAEAVKESIEAKQSATAV